MKKIIIVGTSGSGKSTLGKKLSKKLNIPHIQMDSILFLDNWVERPNDEFLKMVDEITDTESWILDGNFGRTQSLSWPKADTIIWIDLPFYLTFYQNLTRTLKRIIFNEKIWENSNNRESIKMFFSKNSVLVWMVQTYDKNRRRYTEQMLEYQKKIRNLFV